MQRDRGGAGIAAPGAGAAAGAGGDMSEVDADQLQHLMDSPQMQRIRQAVQQNPALIQPLLQQIAASNPQLAAVIERDPGALLELLGIGEDDLMGEGGDEYGGGQVMQVNLTEEEVAAVERVSLIC